MKIVKFLILLVGFSVSAQQSPKDNLPTIIPNSPEATEFMKYGNTSVSMYTGTSQIQIPVYTISGREYSLPISLNYDAGGIRVEQIATQVGLAWSLQAGGFISRVTNGKPDHVFSASDYYGSYYSHYDKLKAFYATSIIENQTYQQVDPNYFPTLAGYFTFEKEDILKGEIDTQPDYFSFNVGNISGEIYIDPVTGKAYSSNGENYKITYTGSISNFDIGGGITGWQITDDDGNQYFFDKYDTTKTLIDAFGEQSNRNYISSWQLTKIISTNSKDIILFNYSYSNFWVNEKFIPTSLSHVSSLISQSPGSSSCSGLTGISTSNAPSYGIAQNYLSSISLNGTTVITFQYEQEGRKDLSSRYALDKINISNGIVWDLRQSYFKSSPSIDLNNVNEDDVRLKLDSIDIKTVVPGEGDKKYAFAYFNPEEVPNRQSFSQDYWGFFNGKTNNSAYGLIPKESLLINGTVQNFTGADREPVLSNSKNGTLLSITYPTGGHTEFEYELHKITKPDESTIVNNSVGIGSLIGGNDPQDPYNYYDDEYFFDDPKGAEFVVPVYEAGVKNFKIKYNSPSLPYGPGDNDDGILFVALIKCSGDAPVKPECNANPPLILPGCPLNLDWEDIIYYPSNERILIRSYKGGPDSEALPNGYSETISLDLEAGYYKLYILNGVTNSGLAVNLDYPSISTQAVTKNVGGLRVLRTKDYTNKQEDPVLVKKYEYTQTVYNSCGIASLASSGKLHYDPKFSYYSYYIKGLDENQCIFLERFAQALNPQQSPHIAYSVVTEKLLNTTGESNGYKEYHFYNTIEEGLSAMHSPPLLKANFKNGKITQVLTFDQSGSIKQKIENIYSQTGVNSQIQGFKSSLGQNKEDAMLIVYNGSPQHFEILRYPYILPPSTTSFGVPFINRANHIYTISSFYAHLDETVTTDYVENEPVITKTSFYYDGLTQFPKTHRNVSRSTITSSKGETLETKTYYPDDVTSVSSLGSDLLTSVEYSALDGKKKTKDNGLTGKHQTTTPIQVEEKIISPSGSIVSASTQRTNFKTWGNEIFPENIQSVKGEITTTNKLNDRISFKEYKDGNLLEVSKKDGPGIVYLWGYNKQYPIAKIENIFYSQISHTYINNAVAASNVDTDNCILTTCKEQILRNQLNAIRDLPALSNALVTTYTYDPLVGVTSMTDPSGYTSYYVYDDFNRLEYIKNKNGEVLEDYKYNYRYEEIVAATNSSASSVSSGQSVSFTTTASGGSGSFTYNWTVSNANLNQVYTNTTGILSVSTTSSHTPNFTVICQVMDNVTNESVSTTSQVNVTTSYPSLSASSISVSPSGTTNKSVGQNVGYSLTASGGSGSYRYNWSKTNSSKTLLIRDFDNSVNNVVTLEDCSGFTIKCLITDLNTSATITKTVFIDDISGCPIQP